LCTERVTNAGVHSAEVSLPFGIGGVRTRETCPC
jgi:hypothetical protein